MGWCEKWYPGRTRRLQRRRGTQFAFVYRRLVLTVIQAGDINRVHALLPDIIGRAKEVYTDLLGTTTKSAFKRYFSSLKKVPSEGFGKLLQENNVRPLRPIMNNLRVKKSESEILNMRKAGQVSGRAFTETMKTPIDTEKDLWTMLDTGFKIGGLDGSAYVPVVAGGKVCSYHGFRAMRY